MEWSKIKTILIWIFVVVNAFLFSVYLKGMYVDNTLDSEVIENTVEILKSHNIIIEKDLVPKIHDSVKVCNIENRYSSVSEVVEGAKNISLQNGKELFNDENVRIEGNSFTIKVNEDKKVSKSVSYVKREMKDTGFLDNVEYSVKEMDGDVYFYLRFQDKIFYDSYIRVKASDKGIQEIYGHNWMGDSVTEGGFAETISPAQILIDFAIENGNTEKRAIKSIQSGYCIGDRDHTVRVTAFPVWEIILDNGDVYYYDMRNGDLVGGQK